MKQLFCSSERLESSHGICISVVYTLFTPISLHLTWLTILVRHQFISHRCTSIKKKSSNLAIASKWEIFRKQIWKKSSYCFWCWSWKWPGRSSIKSLKKHRELQTPIKLWPNMFLLVLKRTTSFFETFRIEFMLEKKMNIIECAKLRALRALVPYMPYVPSSLTCLEPRVSCLTCPLALGALMPYVPCVSSCLACLRALWSLAPTLTSLIIIIIIITTICIVKLKHFCNMFRAFSQL